ncbi:MAG: hypothetical protein ACRDJY_09990 [Thermoleophilaceae bacterium]
MNRDWLRAQLEAGRSFCDIGRELGLDDSSVAYWAKKHGLRSQLAERFAPRGPIDRDRLEAMASEGATLREMAAALDRSIATIRYWIGRWEIERPRRPSRRPDDPATAPRRVVMRCQRHGEVEFCLEGRGYYRCTRCRAERVTEWRRRVKQTLVSEAGGACAVCGYDACIAALQFHHLDPGEKSFMVSREGVTRSLAEVRAEAEKCVLLCATRKSRLDTAR